VASVIASGKTKPAMNLLLINVLRTIVVLTTGLMITLGQEAVSPALEVRQPDDASAE
jgi:hypothetical protein